MSEFTFHDTASAPEGSKGILQKAEGKYGFVPNILRGLADAPAALEGYATLSGIYDKASLSPVERQVVLLATSFENGCSYCMAAHSGAAKMAQMDDAVLKALRTGTELPDAKLQALRAFTQAVVEKRGYADESDLKAFFDAGYSKQNVLEVVLGITLKTLSNYSNHMMEPKLDEQFKPLEWTAPKSEAAQ
ncbi:hypothetical protein JCM17844_08340 [Iodidimonas gelatinilytica]|uniref:Carboxymuconolactone decarboxylase-like domain-containing protein n=1 Tax=Iodidimonas gelatinilytica TaxID=1236966 RepID=A0A5A7MWT7_9PROT|nr:carboxymuconolactone decarboxylase family protein [Iodidimonas gelatinilytica]GEQ97197.1 hypothetical protein JCM17844_08340 [Iodidimonas gelatinilytica]GEQ99528.1 hypothetical protein JCM17845_01520 [Iodidimonas gelatinilytica]